MFATRRRTAAVLLAACAIGVGILTYRVSAAERKGEAKPAKGTEELQALLKARFEVALKECDARRQEAEAGASTWTTPLHILIDWSHRRLTAQVELSDKKVHQVAAHEDHLRRMKTGEEILKANYEKGRATLAEYLQTQYHRLDAEIGLARARVLSHGLQAAERKEEKKPAKVADDLPALLKARLEAARKEVEARKAEYEAGRSTLDSLGDVGRRLLTAEVEASDKKQDKLAAHETYARLMREVEQVTKAKHEAGRASESDYYQAQYYRLDAEILLARAKKK